MLFARSLSCHRGSTAIFEDLSFEALPGQILWLQGPNGAGKSTLLRAMAGLRPLSQGSLILNDQPVIAGKEYPASCLYIGHHDPLQPALTVKDHLTFWCALEKQPVRKSDEAAAFFKLQSMMMKQARQLSAGQKRRLHLSRLMIAQHPVWLLDEPFEYLDIENRIQLVSLIKGQQARGGLIVIASHSAMPDLPNTRSVLLSSRL